VRFIRRAENHHTGLHTIRLAVLHHFERAFLQDYPALPPEAITAAVDELTCDRSDSRVGSLTADWERFFEVLPHGHRARGRAARV
jgi:hypothetical protein